MEQENCAQPVHKLGSSLDKQFKSYPEKEPLPFLENITINIKQSDLSIWLIPQDEESDQWKNKRCYVVRATLLNTPYKDKSGAMKQTMTTFTVAIFTQNRDEKTQAWGAVNYNYGLWEDGGEYILKFMIFNSVTNSVEMAVVNAIHSIEIPTSRIGIYHYTAPWKASNNCIVVYFGTRSTADVYKEVIIARFEDVEYYDAKFTKSIKRFFAYKGSFIDDKGIEFLKSELKKSKGECRTKAKREESPDCESAKEDVESEMLPAKDIAMVEEPLAKVISAKASTEFIVAKPVSNKLAFKLVNENPAKKKKV